MTSDGIHHALHPIVEELGVQIDVLDSEGRQYAEQLMRHYLTTPKGKAQPQKPLGMHRHVARFIRDLVLDEATTIRLQGTRDGHFTPGGSRARA